LMARAKETESTLSVAKPSIRSYEYFPDTGVVHQSKNPKSKKVDPNR